MPLSHVFEYTNADHTTGLAYFIMFIGSHHFAAPVFMLSMGLGMTYSRRNDPNTMMKRGLSIFTAGIILNMARFLAAMTGFLATDNPDMQYLAIGELVIVDIFQLAGLSMMLMGLFLRIRMPYWGMLLFAVAASLTGSQMHMITMPFHALQQTLCASMCCNGSSSHGLSACYWKRSSVWNSA